MEMYKEMTTKILSQFLIGNVYQSILLDASVYWDVCLFQFLIGNVYRKTTPTKIEKVEFEKCQFLIGNVYLL